MKTNFKSLPSIHVEEYQNYGDVKNVSIPDAEIVFNGRVEKLERKHEQLICRSKKAFTKPFCLIYATGPNKLELKKFSAPYKCKIMHKNDNFDDYMFTDRRDFVDQGRSYSNKMNTWKEIAAFISVVLFIILLIQMF